MPIYTPTQIIEDLPKRECAICSFNVHNIEYVEAVIRAAEDEKAPVILAIGESIGSYTDLDLLVIVCRYFADKCSVPVSIMLDHGKTDSVISKWIENGLSVMFDGSELPLDQNIAVTRKYAEKVHAAHGSIEGELGIIRGYDLCKKSKSGDYTIPEEALRFVTETGVDLLAVSVGNQHGVYQDIPAINLDLIKRIRDTVNVPLVLHGGSGIPPQQIRDAISSGIKKINIGTELKCAFASTLKSVLVRDPMPFQPKELIEPAIQAVYEVSREKIRLCRKSESLLRSTE